MAPWWPPYGTAQDGRSAALAGAGLSSGGVAHQQQHQQQQQSQQLSQRQGSMRRQLSHVGELVHHAVVDNHAALHRWVAWDPLKSVSAQHRNSKAGRLHSGQAWCVNPGLW